MMEAGGPPVPPQTPGNPGLPPRGSAGAPGAPGAGGPTAGKPSGLWWAGAAAVAIILAVGGYFLGTNREANNYKAGAAGYQQIYKTGFDEGSVVGTTAGKKSGDAYGKKRGVRYGKHVGYKAGNSAGLKQGEVQGTADGASAALGGLTGWDSDTHYIVTTINPTLQGVPAAINKRSAMQGGFEYALCSSNPSLICTKPKQ